MTPKLRVLIPGSSSAGYPPTEICSVNSSKPTKIENDHFKGDIWVFVKGFNGQGKDGEGDEYFDTREGMTYGIVVKGHFLEKTNANDIVFGNVFENPIRDSLPWGTSIATKFMYFIDPTLELDIYADKPWALSPALASLSYLSLSASTSGSDKSEEVVVRENTTKYLSDKGLSNSSGTTEEDEKTSVGNRRKWFAKKENREKVVLDKNTEVGFEFCNGLLDFNTLSATLPPPFHLSVPLLKYWDGQPVTYTCQKRSSGGNPVGGTNKVYWSVAFEIIDEDALERLAKKGGKVVKPGHEKDGDIKTDKDGEEVKQSEDID